LGASLKSKYNAIMPANFKRKPIAKENLHPRNLHRARYDFEQLIKVCPELKAFVKLNQYNSESIDFSAPEAVKMLNKALLKYFYAITDWDIPAGYLCPPIPGRADYIHYMADLLGADSGGIIPEGGKIKVLDIGTGANCVYPLIGNSVYGWKFVGTDIDPVAIQSAKKIISLNPKLKGAIECRLQTHGTDIFKGVVEPGEVFDLTICNPPFHASLQEAQAGTTKKWENLDNNKKATLLNFGGKNNELWCVGGEAAFISHMVHQSIPITKQCLWFSTLVSKKDNLEGIYKALKKAEAVDIKTINMSQGQKISRIVAWTFLNAAEQSDWKKQWST
jgi:23S rRNA (adenine1618-N6)-methyltransferase